MTGNGVVDGEIVALDRVEARVEGFDWGFARDRADEIAAHWEKISAGKPAMFNGRVMLQHRAAIEGGVFHAGYFEADYAAFLSWRDFGLPPPAIRNGFAMAALRAADGAFLLGRMGDHTANPGKVYFAAGTPDREDARPDGTLDLAGSVTRELCEETGLTLDEIAVDERWTAVIVPGRVAFMRPVGIDLPAGEARELMLARIAQQDEPELSDIVIVRNLADCAAYDMPPFMTSYLAHIYGRD
ncbi:NUDIX hydrolase [Bosea sp. (in: a-proteobacteria)]|uniref:NUDIX hydrolase n=1 Tax=Bosea sp. (in: a-proteobacteria) TaxID=1871050 RepID=UPI002DDD08D3|nr:NUDIX hydrolase [Bosea sp. (in: a-proteobacteria)]HEV2511018.1 NUDIX hydrolase [Bosea sp. (in: a-proteobacteria)]